MGYTVCRCHKTLTILQDSIPCSVGVDDGIADSIYSK